MDAVLSFILTAHSWLRWLVALIAVVALVRFGYGWLTKQTFKPMDRGIMSGLAGSVDLQFLLGLILLFGLGFAVRERLEHAVTMLLVVIAGHLPMRWKNASDTIRFRNNFITVAVMIVLVIAGVYVIRPGWSIWLPF